MKVTEKFINLGSMAVISAAAIFFVNTNPGLQEAVDNFVFNKTGTSLFNPVENTRFNFLKDESIKGVSTNSLAYLGSKDFFESIDTPEYKLKLKEEKFFNEELSTIRTTRDEEIKQFAIIEAETAKLYSKEVHKPKIEPIIVDLFSDLPPLTQVDVRRVDNNIEEGNFGLGTIDEPLPVVEKNAIPSKKITNTSITELRKKYISNPTDSIKKKITS